MHVQNYLTVKHSVYLCWRYSPSLLHSTFFQKANCTKVFAALKCKISIFAFIITFCKIALINSFSYYTPDA